MSLSKFSDLRIDCLPVNALKPDPRNPRSHSNRQVRQIAKSIEAFGFNVPVLVDAKNMIISGHGRVLACKLLNRHEVPVVRLDSLTEAQARAFAIADNRLTDGSSFDNELLGTILHDLTAQELDFDLEATGFTMGEIDIRIAEVTGESEKADDPADALADKSGVPVCQIGDHWLLGKRHRVLCGNALDAKAYETLLAGSRAAMVFTDPPYNVRIDGNVSGKGAVQHREFVMASGEMTDARYTAFLTLVCSNLASHSVLGAVHHICMDWRHIGSLIAAGSTAFTELLNVCVWVKPNAGMGSFYRSQHELVAVFKSGRGSHRNNVQLGRFGRNRTNVWNYPGANSFGRATEEGNLAALHPTVKPVRLIADAILDCSARGDVLLDPFLGSGSTVIAAERTGRRCFGIEIDPLYVDTVVRRWQAYAGERAIHAVTGRLFDDVEREVGDVRS